jgi:hypothetical protein
VVVETVEVFYNTKWDGTRCSKATFSMNNNNTNNNNNWYKHVPKSVETDQGVNATVLWN